MTIIIDFGGRGVLTNRNVIKITIRGMRPVGIYERVASGVIYTNRKPAYYLNRFFIMTINVIAIVFVCVMITKLNNL